MSEKYYSITDTAAERKKKMKKVQNLASQLLKKAGVKNG
jgi:hypothetical protein